MSETQRIILAAAPTGGVTVYFTGISNSMKFNIGGPNDGWWWDGGRISRDQAEVVLLQRTIRALVKSTGGWGKQSQLSRIMQG